MSASRTSITSGWWQRWSKNWEFETIDALIPYSDDRILSHGEGAKAMLINGLGYVNKQPYQTPNFFEDKPLKRLFGKELEKNSVINSVRH